MRLIASSAAYKGPYKRKMSEMSDSDFWSYWSGRRPQPSENKARVHASVRNAADGEVEGEPLSRLLKAGEVFCSTSPAQVTVFVGPSVAVCVWDPAIHVGGVQHLHLPRYERVEPARSEDLASAVEQLLVSLFDLGCRPDNLQAGLFGGASAGEASAAEVGSPPDGRGNSTARAARAFLEAEGIPIVTSDVGGTAPRRVAFRTDAGTAAVTQFRPV